jgi:CHAT domain-containing protein
MRARALALAAGLGVLLFAAAVRPQQAPPRSAADIIAVLDEHKPDPSRVTRQREELEKQPPATTDRIDLRRFYTARAEAAGELGALAQQVADLRKALEYAPPGDPDRWSLYIQLGAAEQQAGDFAAAVRMWNEAPSAAVSGGQPLAAWAAVAGVRASVGDVAGAHQALARAESILNELRITPGWPAFQDLFRSGYQRARGTVLRSEGKYAEAEIAFREAIALTLRVLDNYQFLQSRSRLPMPPRVVFVRNLVRFESGLLGLTLLDQGRFSEAEVAARNALKRALSTFGKYSAECGSVAVILGRILFEQGRFHDAAALYRAAADIYERIGAAPHSSTVVNSLRGLGATLVEEGKHAEADAVFTRMRKGLEQNPEAAEILGRGSLAWVYALARLGRGAEAVAQAARIRQTSERRYGDRFYVTLEARGFHALALAANGNDDEAVREFRAVIPLLLAAAAEQSGDEGVGVARAIRLKRVLESYVAVLGRMSQAPGSIAGFDPMAESFLVVDAARGSSVQHALASSTARASIRDPAVAKLARDEQDAAQHIASLTRILVELLARPEDKRPPGIIAKMRDDLERLRRERAQMRQEIEKRSPEYANLVNPKPVSLDAARKALLPGEALVVVYGTEDRTFAWAIPKEGAPRFHVSPLGSEQREALVAHLRKALDVGDVPLERFPQFDVAASHRLYAELMAPLEPAWGGARSLIVVPHGRLGELPFGVLATAPRPPAGGGTRFEGYRGVPWLLRRAAITQLPSVNTLVSLRAVARTRAPTKPFAGFGNPVFDKEQVADARPAGKRGLGLRSPAFEGDPSKRLSSQLGQLSPLPDTADEIESIARALGGAASSALFLGRQASERSVKTTDLSEHRVIAFATHGLVPGELDGLTQPALALSNPAVTGEQDADGLLAMDEILGLRLNADWVVLSACNTASGSGEGSEAVSGLGRAFFYAGARALLVSNWPVETVSAKLLTVELFRRQAADAKLARAEALRQAMLQVMDREIARDDAGKPSYSYAHPMFWAPFSLVGDGN